ncbi:hypothetical protein CEXT_316061 [Caerostris extrusa]|uniref:Uncharacterized protein n=1 Tax=Caerostris extrusa TaxID=172846 RepID=A0AAV4Q181_CAEEX|nr:hypothetical protein CEXT_316061 [Caerostris extrusa]
MTLILLSYPQGCQHCASAWKGRQRVFGRSKFIPLDSRVGEGVSRGWMAFVNGWEEGFEFTEALVNEMYPSKIRICKRSVQQTEMRGISSW